MTEPEREPVPPGQNVRGTVIRGAQINIRRHTGLMDAAARFCPGETGSLYRKWTFKYNRVRLQPRRGSRNTVPQVPQCLRRTSGCPLTSYNFCGIIVTDSSTKRGKRWGAAKRFLLTTEHNPDRAQKGSSLPRLGRYCALVRGPIGVANCFFVFLNRKLNLKQEGPN